MKYFVLDFNDEPNYYSTYLTGVLQMAIQNEGSEIFQFGRSDYLNYANPDHLFKDIVHKLVESDVIVSLGRFDLLTFLNNVAGFRDALLAKIDSRTPFFFQFNRMWETLQEHKRSGDDRLMSVQRLLDNLLIYPTSTKIFGHRSFNDIYESNIVNFDPIDVDPGISTPFANGRSVWIDGPNLLAFGEGNHALLGSGSHHRHVNEMDFGIDAPEFQGQSAFVVRQTDNHFGFLCSGAFFATDFQIGNQRIPVGEANWTAITRIVRALESNVRLLADA